MSDVTDLIKALETVIEVGESFKECAPIIATVILANYIVKEFGKK